jgi:hypothetical protein
MAGERAEVANKESKSKFVEARVRIHSSPDF